MGLFGGVKQKLGFGEQPEWQDDEYAPYDDGYDDEAYDDEGYEDEAYDDEAYDDGYEDEDDGYSATSATDSVVGFDDYNPNRFEHIRLSTDREIKVASYDDDGRGSYFANRVSSGSGYGSNIGTTASRRAASTSNVRSISDRASGGADWGAPSDPAFLDNTVAATRSSVSSYSATSADSSDPYAQFDTDVRRVQRDPGARLEVVLPTSYADVEKIANAFKAGKSVVLSLVNTKPDLAKRILDFSFGVACALNGTVDKAADRVFVISKGTALTASDREYLRKQGILK